jgi:hypothetical protein
MRLLLASALLTMSVVGLSAQASEFGIRGLGIPGRELSTRAVGLGGATGLFDGESSLNPAALSTLTTTTGVFTTLGDWRNTANPAGSLSTRSTRFPQVAIGGPIPRKHLALGISYSLYTDRDFTVVSDGTASPRGVPVAVHDTSASRGGVDDIRVAGAWVVSSHFAIGGGLHFLTGSNRLSFHRFWEDSTYQSPRETAELAYSGIGASIGALWQPTSRFSVAGVFRHDGSLDISRDSTGSGRVQAPSTSLGSVRLPTTIGGALRLGLTPRATFSGSVMSRNWSVADAGIVDQGAIGARNTMEYAAGLELVSSLRRPARFPLRLGAHYSTLPFLLDPSDPQPHEYGFSIGTGRRFAAERGGFDLALEHVWRSQGGAYTESATLLTFGISVRPGLGN